MTRNLETADRIVKVTLALLTLVFYFFDVMQGPFAQALMILGAIVILLNFIKIAVAKDG